MPKADLQTLDWETKQLLPLSFILWPTSRVESLQTLNLETATPLFPPTTTLSSLLSFFPLADLYCCRVESLRALNLRQINPPPSLVSSPLSSGRLAEWRPPPFPSQQRRDEVSRMSCRGRCASTGVQFLLQLLLFDQLPVQASLLLQTLVVSQLKHHTHTHTPHIHHACTHTPHTHACIHTRTHTYMLVAKWREQGRTKSKEDCLTENH